MSDNREDVLLNSIMRLIQAELRDAPTNLRENRVYHLVNEIMRRATDELHNAMTSENDEMRYYISDDVYDEMRNPIFTLQLANEAMTLLFEGSSSVELVDAMQELIENILLDIDDLIDNDNYLPVGMQDLINIIRR